MTLQSQPLATNDIDDGLENGWQLPASFYSDPQIFELEKELIFHRSWQYVTTTNKLQKTGDFITTRLGDIPIVITRDKDGELHGHVNACLHRLHPIAVGEGCKKIFQCRYHGWTYALNGQLRTAPRSQEDPNFDKSELQLTPIQVEVLGNLVFANADQAAAPLTEVAGNATELIDKLALDFSEWEHSGTFTYDIDANWKLFMENSLECYHCDLVHNSTFGEAFETDPDNYICENFDEVLTQVAPLASAPPSDQRAVSELDRFRLLFVWPVTAMSIDEYTGTIVRLVPQGAKRCRFIVETFARPGVDPQILQEWLAMYDATFKEDKEVVAAQQAGYDSQRVNRGRLMPLNESSIAMFQRRTWQALKDAIAGEGTK